MRKQKLWVKTLSIILTVLLVAEILPLSVWAADLSEKKTVQNATIDQAEKESPIKGEIISEREAYKKVYEREDGTYTAFLTSEPIHYYEDGKWEEIDNTLSSSNGVITNKSNSFSVDMPAEINDNKKITVSNGNSELAFTMADIDKTTAKINNNLSAEIENKVIDTNPSQVIYQGVKENTDLKYDINTDSIKESIVLDVCPDSEISYTYNMNTDGGELILNQDKSIDIVKNGKKTFTIMKPFMVDTQEQLSENIDVFFINNGNSSYTVTYTPDYEWLTSKSTVYPVTIDPTINIYSQRTITEAMVGTTSATDAELATFHFVENKNGNDSQVYFKYPNKFYGDDYRNVIVTNAEFSAYCKATDDSDTIAAYGINSTWDADTITAVNLNTKYYDYNEIEASGNYQRYVWNITEAAHDWSLGITENNGIALKAYNDDNCKTQIYRSLGSVYTVNRPWFELDYVLVDNASAWEVESIEMGRAGTMYINKYAGSYYIQRTDLGLSGNVMPYDLSYTYDPWGYTTGMDDYFGNYWHINNVAKLYYNNTENYNNANRKKFTLWDMGGTRVIFHEVISSDDDYNTVPDGINEAYLENYVRYKASYGTDSKTLWVPKSDTNCSNPSNMFLEDSAYIYSIDAASRISTIKNKSNNAVIANTFIGSGSTKVKEITDGVGRKYTASYGSDSNSKYHVYGFTVKNTSNSTINIATLNGNVAVGVNYEYNYLNSDFNLLKTVTYADGEKVKYTYNNNHMLSTITDIDGTKWEITYTGDRISKVVKKAGTQQTFAGAFEIDYASAKLRVFKRYDPSSSINPKEVEMVRYNSNAQQISTISKDGSYSYNEYENPRDTDSNLLSYATNDNNATNLIKNSRFDYNSDWTFVPSNAGYINTSATTTFDNNFSKISGGRGEINSNKYESRRAYQTIDTLTANEGDEVYTVSAWLYIADDISASNNITSHKAAEKKTSLCVLDENGEVLAQYSYDTTATSSAVQFGAVSFKINETLNNVKVVIANDYQTGSIYFDDVRLFKTTTSFVDTTSDDANEEGPTTNPSTITLNGTTYKTAHCYSCTCVQCSQTYTINFKGQQVEGYYNCSCDSENGDCNCWGCRQERATEEIKDSNGNVISQKVAYNSKSITTSNTYSSNGNYLKSTINSNLNTMYYNYNEDNGLLTSNSQNNATDTVNYVYDAMGVLTKVTQAVSGLDNGTAMTSTYTYEKDRVKTISNSGTTYTFEYDEFGNQTNVKVGNQSLVSQTYTANKSDVNAITFGNGTVISYTYDDKGNINKIKYNGETAYTYDYNDYNTLTDYYDYFSKLKTVISSEGTTTVYPFEIISGQITLGEATFSSHVNDEGNKVETVDGTAYTSSSNEKYSTSDDTVKSTSTVTYGNNKAEVITTKDFFGRTVGKTYTLYKNGTAQTPIKYIYGYGDFGSYAGSLITDESFTFGDSLDEFKYNYYVTGNLRNIGYDLEDTKPCVEYTYDEAGQLTQVYNPVSCTATVYKYDINGNIVSKTSYTNANSDDLTYATVENIINYTYDDSSWDDKLTSYNGQPITYDNIGNPLSYKGATLTWQSKQLESYTKGNERYVYTYNADGLRTSKTKYVNNVIQFKDIFIWNNGVLDTMKRTNASGTIQTVHYLYDNNSDLFGFVCNGTTYLYIKNALGEILGVANAESNTALYGIEYDEWGKPVFNYADELSNVEQTEAQAIIDVSGYAYRNYFYDQESGLYYLQSRYYDSDTRRFISADDVGFIAINNLSLSVNLYAYCLNNPITGLDIYGNFSLKELVRGALHKGNNFAVSAGINTAKLGAFFLMMKPDEDGIYHADFNCWQRFGGYNKFYDRVFDFGTSMKALQMPFYCDGKGYTFWAWKGDYINLGAGAELGIYKGAGKMVAVDRSLAIEMNMLLVYKGKIIISYAPSKPQWWITGFNPKYQNVDADDLNVAFFVYFNRRNMYKSFKDAYSKYTSFIWYDSKYIAVIVF